MAKSGHWFSFTTLFSSFQLFFPYWHLSQRQAQLLGSSFPASASSPGPCDPIWRLPGGALGPVQGPMVIPDAAGHLDRGQQQRLRLSICAAFIGMLDDCAGGGTGKGTGQIIHACRAHSDHTQLLARAFLAKSAASAGVRGRKNVCPKDNVQRLLAGHRPPYHRPITVRAHDTATSES